MATREFAEAVQARPLPANRACGRAWLEGRGGGAVVVSFASENQALFSQMGYYNGVAGTYY